MIHYPSATPEGGPTGLGGWLVVVSAGLTYTVLSMPFILFEEWLPWLLDPATWGMLAARRSPLLLAMLIVEQEMWPFDSEGSSQTAVDTVIAFLWVVVGVPYIARSRRVKNTFTKRAAAAAASPAG